MEPPPAYDPLPQGIDINREGFNASAVAACRLGTSVLFSWTPIPNLYTAKAMERIDIKIDSSARKVLDLLTPVQNQLQGNNESLSLPSVVLAGLIGVPTPKLNIVIQIAGYRGDIQPFISLGLALKHSSHRSVSQPTRSFKAL